MSSYLERFNFQLNGPENGRQWIFLHGLMGYGSNWRKIVSGLESTERILTFDQRGHGRSFKPEKGYSSEDYAEDLFQIMTELGWKKVILVGHSMGGRNALAFAARHPHLVDKLVIEDIGADANPKAIDYYEKLLSTVPTPFTTKLQAKEFFLNEWPKTGLGKSKNLILGQYLYSNIEEKSDGSADWRFSKKGIIESVALGRAKEMWSELRNLSMPTLIIRGEHSEELSHEEFQRMLACNSKITGVEISNAGHWVHSDQPQEFQRVIAEFAFSQ